MEDEVFPGPEEEPGSPKKMKKWLVILLAVIIGIAVLAAVYLGLCWIGESASVNRTVLINGVDVTGMEEQEALDALQADYEEAWQNVQYSIAVKEETYPISLYAALAFDEEAAKEVLNTDYQDKDVPFLMRGINYIFNRGPKEETAEYTVAPKTARENVINDAVVEIAQAVKIDVVNGSWELQGDNIVVTMGTHGEQVDTAQIETDIYAAIADGQTDAVITASIVTTAPTEVDPAAIEAAVNSEPKNAQYQLTDGEVTVVPSENGRQITAADITTQITGAAEGSTVTIATAVTEPEVKTEDLQTSLFADVITSYQVVDGGSSSQINNQGLACAAVNGKILMPGETFSFNELVGETTYEKGYVDDYAYSNGKLVKEPGGGICRVASTLYAAVLSSDLEVVMRYNHSSPVHYLPLGMDATVSYPLPDLQFKNNRDYPIKIEMNVSGGYVNATIYGTAQDDDPYVEVKLNNITDMKVETYREYYTEKGGEFIKEEYMHTSTYKELSTD